MPLIYVIAGEQSGDVLGGRLIRALRARVPDAEFAGIGGERMRAQGLVSRLPVEPITLMGILEILPRLHTIRRYISTVAEDIGARRPDVVVTIDSPGFTLRVLRAIGPLGMKRAHYVAPQVWAWRERRVHTYPGVWDRLLCLLPFEPEYFAQHGLPARFVGHPVLESGADRGDGQRFHARHVVPPGAPIVTFMPGSRMSEVTRHLPIIGETLRLLPSVVPVVPLAGPVADAVQTAASAWPVPPVLVSDEPDKYDAFAASSAALTKSGTSTLELAMADIPMIVAYRVNPLSAAIAKRLVKVRYAALVNLLTAGIGRNAGHGIVPEFIQRDCTPEALARTLQGLLHDSEAAARQRVGFRAALESLRPAGGLLPSEAAAEAVIELMQKA